MVIIWRCDDKLFYDFVDNLYTESYRQFMGDDFNPELEAKKDWQDDFVSLTDVETARRQGAERA